MQGRLTELTVDRQQSTFTIFGGPLYLNQFVQYFYLNVLELAKLNTD